MDVEINDAAIAQIAGLPGIQEHLDQVADRVARAARTGAARHVGDASYMRSIKVRRAGRRAGRRGEGRLVISEDEQAAIVEYGVRPHTITAGPGKLLWWPGARHPVKVLHHPGTPAFHVFGNAADAARGG